jgi:hypothetical protein
LDEFTLQRILRLIGAHKQTHGRDVSEGELRAAGIAATVLDRLVRGGVVDKYQVTTGKGSTENRFKVHKDWRSLNVKDL